MKLSKVLMGVPYESDSIMDVDVSGVEYNSRNIKTDNIFIALKGSVSDGHDYIRDAVEHGALAVIGGKNIKIRTIPYVKVKNLRNYLPTIAGNFYGNLSEKMTVIGVTGTNGKTTVTYLMETILRYLNEQVLIIGTINYRVGAVVYPSVNTTPSIFDIYKYMKAALNKNINYCVMEVSSHSIALKRVEGITFKIAAYTNLSQEHLDFHKTMADYAATKKSLFDRIDVGDIAVINKDDKYAPLMVRDVKGSIIYYSVNQSAEIAANIKNVSLRGSDLEIIFNNVKYPVHSELIGVHNIYNILCAFSIGIALNLEPSRIVKGIEQLKTVPGRMERIDTDLGFTIYIDYAHTPDALEKVISGIKEISSGKLMVVFGAGGDRDKGKRPVMGKVVTGLADFAVVTEDDPRTEDTQKIIQDIISGIESTNYKVIPDRDEAIDYALKHSAAGDIVLIAGKGHEQYQIIGHKKIKYSDFETVKNVLKKW